MTNSGKGWHGPRQVGNPSPPYKDETPNTKKKLTKKGEKIRDRVQSRKSKGLIVPKFKTLSEVSKWIKENNIAKSVKLGKINIATLSTGLQRYIDLRKEYGIDNFVLDEIYFNSRGNSSFFPGSSKRGSRLNLGWPFGWDVKSDYNRMTAEETFRIEKSYNSSIVKNINFRLRELKDYERDNLGSKSIRNTMKRDIEKLKESSKYQVFGVVGDRVGKTNHIMENAKETITHEFGHILENQVIGVLGVVGKGFYNKKLSNKLSNMYSNRNAPDNDVTKISEYANSNIDEYFAEGLTQYYHCKSRPLPKNMKSLIEDVKRESLKGNRTKIGE